MKVIWEEADIQPGREYGKDNIKERFIIGFRPELNTNQKYVSISLSDGMVTYPSTKVAMAANLTDAGYLPAELLGSKQST